MSKRRIQIIKPDGVACALGKSCDFYHTCKTATSAENSESKPYRIIKVPRNKVVLRNVFDGTLVVRKGVLLDFAYTLRGNPYIFAIFGKGSVLGADASFASLVNDSLLPIEDVEFCLVTFKMLELALSSNESLLKEIVTVGNMSINAFGKYSWMLQGKSVADRILRFFSLYVLLDTHTQGDIAITVSQENLALIIGSERTTVTKILKRFAKSGIVELKPRSIVVKREYWSSKLCRPENIWDEYSY